jgi:type I restriction enzyme S subunit
MKEVWPTKTLGEVCGFVRGPFGGSLKKSIFVADGFAVYEQQHAIYDQFEDIRYFIDDEKFREMRRFELRPNDLIMSCSGTMGKVAIVPGNIRRGIINQALLKLTPSAAVLPEFLKYWMDSRVFQDSLKEQSGGAAIQNVASVGILKEIQISLPPLPEQQRIIGILDETFKGIATARANAEKNVQNARALFESHLQSVFTKRGLGWVQKRLGEVADFKNGLNFSKNSSGQSVRVVGVGDFQSNSIVPTADLGSVTIDGDLNENYAIRKNDILTVRSNGSKNLVGRCMLVPEVRGVVSYSGFIIRIRFDTNAINPKFLLHFMKCSATRDRLTREGGGANISNINQEKLSSLSVPLPSLSTQQEQAEKLDHLQVETQRLASLYEQKITALDALKRSLLHQAFTGNL